MSTGTTSSTGSTGTGSTLTDSTTPPPTFLQSINNSDIGQLVALASNVFGTMQGVLTILELFGVNPLGSGDTQSILNAIAQLQQQLQQDFEALGSLITQQIQIAVDTTNRDTMALALANSDTGVISIQEFLTTSDAQSLESAETASLTGLHFFTELGLDASDLPFFMPGLVKAGSARIFVLASEPPNFRVPAVVKSDLQAMTSFLAQMIADVTDTVSAAHTVVEKNHEVRVPSGGGNPVLPNTEVFIIDGFAHDEHGEQLAFFPCERDPASPFVPTAPFAVQQALALAEQARTQGISDELAALGIPQYQQILDSWNTLLAQGSLPSQGQAST